MSNRILHIISGDLWGGAEAQAFMQIEALAGLASPHKVSVCLFNQGVLGEKLEGAGVECFFIDEKKGLVSLVSQAKSSAKNLPADMVVTHGYKEAFAGLFISRSLKIPLVTVFHGLGEKHQFLNKFKNSVYTLLHRLIARIFARKIITVSDTLAAELGFAKMKKQQTIYNCAYSRNILSVDPHKPESSTPSFVIVGRLVAIKRVDIAIRAFSEILKNHSAKLLIIGEGAEEEQLKKLSKQLELESSVEFLGFKENALDYICRSDGLLITSEHEGVPTVLLEAINAGIPIISSDLEGIREVAKLVPNYPIHFFRFPDPSSAADAIATVLESENDKSKSERELTKIFTPEASAQKHLSIYDELLSSS